MPIPESKFEDWHSTGADNGSKTARGRIERLLRMDRSPIEQNGDCDFKVILQGSYKNTTHTYGSSDVDIVVKLQSSWRRNLSDLTREERARYNENTSSADYSYTDFRSDVWDWLSQQFDEPEDSIEFGNKAIAIESDRLDVDVDVVPCADYRVYKSYPPADSDEDPEIIHGMYFETRRTGTRIINYPQVHYENGCDMHSNFKETVRIFKNARDYYNESWDTWRTIDAPSYYIECLIYNVPEDILKRTSRSDRFDEILEFLEDDNTDLTTFQQVSEMEKLFGDEPTQWDVTSAETMVFRLREMWDDWYTQHNARLFN